MADNKVKFFENSSIDKLNTEIAEFLETENAAIIDVKLVINQSTHKLSYSKHVVTLIYTKNTLAFSQN